MRGKRIILYTDQHNDKQVFDSLLYACEYLAIPYRSAIRHISKGEKHEFNGCTLERLTIQGRIKDYSGNSANFTANKDF